MWLEAAREMLVELRQSVQQPTAPAAQTCAQEGSCGSEGDSEEDREAKSSDVAEVLKNEGNDNPPPPTPLKLSSRQLRNLKSKLRSLVARKDPRQLTKVNRWIKVLLAAMWVGGWVGGWGLCFVRIGFRCQSWVALVHLHRPLLHPPSVGHRKRKTHCGGTEPRAQEIHTSYGRSR